MREDTLVFLGQVTDMLESVAGLVRRDTDEVAVSGNHIAVIKHFDQVRRATELIKESREAIKQIEETLSRETVPDVMRNAGVKTITVETVGRVTVSHRFNATMLDKELGIKWLRENGHGGIVQETVNASTLSAFAKSALEDTGVELPTDLFKVGTVPYTSITKVR